MTTILSSTDDILKFFSRIQLEYRQGYMNLKEKLKKRGFKVSVTRLLLIQFNSNRGKTMLYTGFFMRLITGIERSVEYMSFITTIELKCNI